MNDPRIAAHAKIIVDHSCKVKRNDFVIIFGNQESTDLAIQLSSELGRIGAWPLVLNMDDAENRAFLLSADDETLTKLPPQIFNLFRDMDVLINLSQFSTSNSQELSDVPPRKFQLHLKAAEPLSKVILGKRWNVTLHPTRALAQAAGMSFEAYCDFVYSAILRDWNAMESEMKVLYDKMINTKQVRIVGDDTDISMSIEGRVPIIDKGEKNLPGGEVFISPVDMSVDGKVYFDLPLVYLGHEVKGCRLEFRNGIVVDFSAEEGSDILDQMLASDEGAKRLGELGIGMNRGITRFTRNILFDEKMGDTIHLALGLSFEESGGTNKSAIHIDMIKSMRDHGSIYFDGEPIYRDGKFSWE